MPLKHEIITITPAKAKQLLERNEINRPLKGSAIKRYAEDMKAGHWVLNGEAILQREDGMLLNGQNRLHACIEADTPFQTLFVSGLNGNAMDTIDIGLPRSLADQLSWRGIHNSAVVAAAVKWGWRYDRMVSLGLRQMATVSPPREAWIEYFETHEPYFVAAAATIVPLRRQLPGPTSIHVFVHFLMSRLKSFKMADEFWNEVAHGSEENAASVLQNWLLDRRGAYRRPPLIVQAAVEVKAARFWLKGQTPKALLWKRTGVQKGEPFPHIDQDLPSDMIATS